MVTDQGWSLLNSRRLSQRAEHTNQYRQKTRSYLISSASHYFAKWSRTHILPELHGRTSIPSRRLANNHGDRINKKMKSLLLAKFSDDARFALVGESDATHSRGTKGKRKMEDVKEEDVVKKEERKKGGGSAKKMKMVKDEREEDE
ncbi:hypothetical protein CI109_101696 [Kwoniella shandongensis]|uniref:Uncharacterized protein n=1 Tax=Kwoniella shandongensis TaxID=1734106 RepID=A0AAJ8MVJ5_9TREE